MKERLPGIDKRVQKEPLTESEKGWLGKTIDRMKLPKKNLKIANKVENPPGQEQVMATWQPANGELTLFKKINEIPPIAQRGVIAHEVGGHGASPLNPANDEIYGSRDKRIEALKTAEKTADDCLEHGVYMDGYHKYLSNKFERGEIPKELLVEETNAIRVQKIFEDPKGLKIKAEALKKKAAKKGRQAIDFFKAAEDNVLKIIKDFRGNRKTMHEHNAKHREELLKETNSKILKQMAPAMMAI